VTVVSCSDEDHEATFILDKIYASVAKQKASYGSFGILYRTRAQVSCQTLLLQKEYCL
jgi:superfamily I DNA/RNA helicase